MAQPIPPGQFSLPDLGPRSPDPGPEVSPSPSPVPSRPAGRMPPEGPTRGNGVSSWPGPAMAAAPVDVAEYLTALVGRGVGIATVRQSGHVLSPGLRPAVRRPVVRTAVLTCGRLSPRESLCKTIPHSLDSKFLMATGGRESRWLERAGVR